MNPLLIASFIILAVFQVSCTNKPHEESISRDSVSVLHDMTGLTFPNDCQIEQWKCFSEPFNQQTYIRVAFQSSQLEEVLNEIEKQDNGGFEVSNFCPPESIWTVPRDSPKRTYLLDSNELIIVQYATNNEKCLFCVAHIVL